VSAHERIFDSDVMREAAAGGAAFVAAPRRARGIGLLLRFWYEHFIFYGLLVAFGITSLAWSLIAAILYPLLPRRLGEPLGQFMIMAGFRYFVGLMKLSGLIKCDLTALDRLRGQPSLVIIPNHPTLLDAVLVISRLPRVVCTAKAGLLRNLFLGGGARLAGFIRNDVPTRLIREGVQQVRAGRQLLIFPEGTRTGGKTVDDFKGGFALIARRAGAPVQTVLIESNSRFLGKGWPLTRKPDFPLRYRVRLGPAVAVEGDLHDFVDALQRHYQHELGAADL
jgi:1-acyl-sn-glycerol-3-phosphate acyltransferase